MIEQLQPSVDSSPELETGIGIGSKQASDACAPLGDTRAVLREASEPSFNQISSGNI